eukprot:jgi/Psemu1/63152/estExt_Genemark1.C_180165
MTAASSAPFQTAATGTATATANANANAAGKQTTETITGTPRRRSPRKRKMNLRLIDNGNDRNDYENANANAMKVVAVAVAVAIQTTPDKTDRCSPMKPKSNSKSKSRVSVSADCLAEKENAPSSSLFPLSSVDDSCSSVVAGENQEQEVAPPSDSSSINFNDNANNNTDDNGNDNEDGNSHTEPTSRAITTTTVMPSSPSYLSPPCSTETESKNRLSLLLSLRPPPLSTAHETGTTADGNNVNVNLNVNSSSRSSSNYNNSKGQTPSSILRRKCTPAKEGDVYDGTTRELSAVDPTSDRHFDALVAFAASAKSPTGGDVGVEADAASRQATPSSPVGALISQESSTSLDEVGEPLVIDLETLGERLRELFPKQFDRCVGRGGRRPRTLRQRSTGVSSEHGLPPPCILPRLIACYTIYRDHQRQQGNVGVELFVNGDEQSMSPSREVDAGRPAKRRRTAPSFDTDTDSEETEATASASMTCSPALQSIAPIHTLLQKLVELEWTVLEGHEHRDEEEGKLIPSTTAATTFANSALATALSNTNDTNHYEHLRRRRVQFAAFDDTAVVRAPSDVLEGSYKPQQNCVEALLSVLDVAEELFPQAVPVSGSVSESESELNGASATCVVRDFVSYLETEFLPQCHDTICVESLMAIEKQNIPIGRIEKAAIAYSRDLCSLLNPEGKAVRKTIAVVTPREANDGDCDGDGDGDLVVPLSIQTVKESVRTRPLSWEYRLANTSAQLVRYWLRTIMNPIPDRSDLETKTDQWNSRLYDFVHLTEPSVLEEFNIEVNRSYDDDDNADDDQDGMDDDVSCSSSIVTFEEDKLSSLLSNALAHLYVYLDLGSMESLETNQSWKEHVRNKIPGEECCDTVVCNEGLGSVRRPILMDEEDWQELEQHLREGSDFCAFYRRALFLERLLTIVTKKNWTDHWNATVRSAAQKLLRLRHGIIQPEDAHLAVLGIPLGDILDRLKSDVLPLTRNRYEVVRANLRRTEKDFRLGCKDTKQKKRCQPRIGIVEEQWKDWWHPGTIFPSVWFRDNNGS